MNYLGHKASHTPLSFPFSCNEAFVRFAQFL